MSNLLLQQQICSKSPSISSSDLTYLIRASGNMTRGNQREKDRERAAARTGGKKGKEDGLTPEQRRERDAKALQEKNAKKAEKAAGGGDAGKSTTKK